MKTLSLPALAGCLVMVGLVAAGAAEAKPWWMRDSTLNDQGFLDPDVAFRVRATLEGRQVHLHWTIADGYYLYRDKMQLRAESPNLSIAAVAWPAGVPVADPNFGPQQVYFDALDASATFERGDFGAHPVQIKVTYQGCAKAGLCYPPITRVLFPMAAAVAAADTADPGVPLHRWELVAILGGSAAFVLAGLMLRKNRRLPLPA